jgi:hypothetical protein
MEPNTTTTPEGQAPTAPERPTPSDAASLLARAAKLEETAASLRRAEEVRADEDIRLGYGRESSIADAATLFETEAARLRRSALPIALGDKVMVCDRNMRSPGSRGFGGERPRICTRVGNNLVYLDGETRPSRAYKLSDGYVNDDYRHTNIVKADLRRIRRDLAPKPKAPRPTSKSSK